MITKRCSIAVTVPLAATPTGDMVFLVTEWGKPFTTVGFGNKFKDWCRQAGLPHCSAHGVRKATAAEFASNQVTPHGIGSITGHRSLKEIENYTRAANQRLLADDAMTKIANKHSSTFRLMGIFLEITQQNKGKLGNGAP